MAVQDDQGAAVAAEDLEVEDVRPRSAVVEETPGAHAAGLVGEAGVFVGVEFPRELVRGVVVDGDVERHGVADDVQVEALAPALDLAVADRVGELVVHSHEYRVP